MQTSDIDQLAALTPDERETIVCELREIGSEAFSDPINAALGALERIIIASGPVAGRCRICGCDEDHACEVEGTGHGMGRFRPCGWADETETLCDAPACIAKAEVQPSPLGDCGLGSRTQAMAEAK